MKAPKVVMVPPALTAALKAEPRLLKIFESMSPPHHREYSEWIASAKKPETTRRRVEKALKMIGDWGKRKK